MNIPENNVFTGNRKLFRYSGYQFDPETELYYLKARYYSPYLGRFITEDPVISMNRYSYCRNNPVSFIDSTGTIATLEEGNIRVISKGTGGTFITAHNGQNTPISPPTVQVQKPSVISEVISGTAQMVGGGFEAVAGAMFGVATSETGIGAVIGTYVVVDGVSNVTGGFTRIMNAARGNTQLGDTGNFMKNIFYKNHKTAYNISQVVISVATLTTGSLQLAGALLNFEYSVVKGGTYIKPIWNGVNGIIVGSISAGADSYNLNNSGY